MIVTREETKFTYLSYGEIKDLIATHYTTEPGDVSIFHGLTVNDEAREISARIKYFGKEQYYVCDLCETEWLVDTLRRGKINYCPTCGTKIDLTEEMNNV